jgi:hypothetical protein
MQFRYLVFFLSFGLNLFGSEGSEWTSWTPLTKAKPKTEPSEVHSLSPKEETLAYNLFLCLSLLTGKVVAFDDVDRYDFKENLRVSGTSDIPDVLVRNVSNDHGVIAVSQTALMRGVPLL